MGDPGGTRKVFPVVANILFVDDELAIRLVLQDTLERLGHSAIGATNVPEALGALSRGDIDLIISDFRMPGLSGLEFLELLREQGRDVPLIMLTGYGTIEHAVAAIKAGAADYITKPLQVDQLQHAVSQALELSRLKRENQALRDDFARGPDLHDFVAQRLGLDRPLAA